MVGNVPMRQDARVVNRRLRQSYTNPNQCTSGIVTTTTTTTTTTYLEELQQRRHNWPHRKREM
jgi:hypothetical protein